MTRFFDALRAANHFERGARYSHETGTGDDVSVLDVLEGRAPTENGTALVPLLEDPWVISPEREYSRFVLQPGCLGKYAGRTLDNRALISNSVNAAVVEHYRRLRTQIMQLHATKQFRSMLVTSACPEEGKTVTVLNLALSFAMLPSFKILVVDGDLRRGSLGQWLGVDDRIGLSNVLEGSATLNEVIVNWGKLPIHFVPRGTSKSPSTELLQTSYLRNCFRRMAEQFALVLVDSPPVNLMADAQLLAGSCDVVLLVARAFSTRRKALEKAVHDLRPCNVIGTILNAGAPAKPYRRYKKYY